jgi:hypothetical protein
MVKCHFQQYLSFIAAVRFIGGGNQSILRKLLSCRRSLTNVGLIISPGEVNWIQLVIKFVSLIISPGEVYWIQLYVTTLVSDLRQLSSFLRILSVSRSSLKKYRKNIIILNLDKSFSQITRSMNMVYS